MPEAVLIIATPACCRRVEQQLDLLPERPVTIGWVTCGGGRAEAAPNVPIIGTVDDLEAIVARRRPDAALICLPSAMRDLVTTTRTRLRRIGVPDRFMPTLEDQLAGIGPRTEFEIDAAQLLRRAPREVDDDSIRSVVSGRSVVITGAGGSIGSELARIVAGYDPRRLVLIDRGENVLFEIDRQIARIAPRLERIPLLHDIVDADGTRHAFDRHRPDLVLHAAAHKHVPMMEDHPASAVENNLFGTVSALDAAVEVGAERFVMISTDKAVRPSSIMGATKRLAELYVQSVNQRVATGCSMVRFGNVLGSSGSVVDTWRRQIAHGGPVTVTHPEMTRYFMTIPEAAALVLQSAALLDPSCKTAEVFLLDMGEPLRIADLAERLVRLHGLEPRICAPTATSRLPVSSAPGVIDIVFTGVRPGEKLFEELAFDAERMRPTRHPDIHVWEVPPPDPLQVQITLARLGALRRSRDAAEIAATVRALVPEMVPAVAA